MRRRDREITDFNRMLEVVSANDVLRIAFDDGDGIYICPVNYGFKADGEKLSFYFHGAKSGRKAKALCSKVESVSFELDGSHRSHLGESGCDSTMYYASVMGTADVTICEGAEIEAGLDAVMNNVFGSEGPFEYKDEVLKNTLVIRLDVREWTCKIH